MCAARICREAGARVRENQLVRELNIATSQIDGRRIEVIANGLPLWGGKQLVIDTTVVSALTGEGKLRGHVPGHVLIERKKDKLRTYKDVADSDR